MNDLLTIEEFHLTAFVPRATPRETAAALRRVLDRPAFRVALLRTIQTLFHRYAALRPATVTVSR